MKSRIKRKEKYKILESNIKLKKEMKEKIKSSIENQRFSLENKISNLPLISCLIEYLEVP